MNCCGNCVHFTHNNLHGFVCNKTMKPAGYLQEKKCFEPKKMKETNTPQTKVCKRCGRKLPAEAFGRHARTKDGLQPVCRECRSKQQKAALKKEEPEEYAIQTVSDPVTVTVDFFPDDVIIESLRKRGYNGTITKQIQITL